MKFTTIKELFDKVKSGEIDSSKLEIHLDNDCTSFNTDTDEIDVIEAGGYEDIEPLYKLLFPTSTVEWV